PAGFSEGSFCAFAGANQEVTRTNRIGYGALLLCAPGLLSIGLTLIPNAAPAHHPTNFPGCRRRVCRGEKIGRPLVDNPGPSIGWREIHQLPRAAANGPRVSASQFRWRWL